MGTQLLSGSNVERCREESVEVSFAGDALLAPSKQLNQWDYAFCVAACKVINTFMRLINSQRKSAVSDHQRSFLLQTCVMLM